MILQRPKLFQGCADEHVFLTILLLTTCFATHKLTHNYATDIADYAVKRSFRLIKDVTAE